MSYTQLKKACKNCKESSIKTYWANIKGLSKAAGKENVPSNAGWLNKNLLKVVASMPLNRSKRFATAAVKAAQMYNVNRPDWAKLMTDSTEKYAKIRESGKRTTREAQNWPEGGYSALGKLAKDMRSELESLEKKKYWTRVDLYHYQRYLIVLFYSKHALRGDLAEVRHRTPYGANWLQHLGNNYKLHIGEHKTVRAHGAIKIDLGQDIRRALDIFLPHLRRLTKHGYLLSTLRSGNRLQRADMLRLIRNTTKNRLGKNIGVQLIRVMKVSAHSAEIDATSKLQQEMGHSSGMQKKYISR